MLRIAEHFHDSDVGRQRQGNEDNYFVRAPLFVVADGMGGAQAGEVASELAVRQFEDGMPDAGDPAAALVGMIQEANAQIHAQARSDSERAGMGTTVTAAYVAQDSVVVAHVGDSRCYLLRAGDLIRLTHDHSLVEELVRQGKLTEEQAEAHPQKSVITCALGPEARVEVDVDTFPARSWDVFLLCSDGLTSMVREPKLKPLLTDIGERSLEQTGRALIAAANEAGGRDNITVILFRLEDVDERAATGGSGRASVTVESDTARTAEYDTFAGEAAEPRQGVTRPSAVSAGDATEAEYRRTGTVALQALPPDRAGDSAAPAREPPAPAAVPSGDRRRRRRGGGLLLLLLVLVLPLCVGAWLATRAVYFVGIDRGAGQAVAIYRGLPYELPFGLDLYERWYASGVTLAQVPGPRRVTFTDHKLRSRDDAEDLITALEEGRIE